MLRIGMGEAVWGRSNLYHEEQPDGEVHGRVQRLVLVDSLTGEDLGARDVLCFDQVKILSQHLR